MCGIFSILSRDPQDEVAPDLIKGLELLEYRGYDSAGIATLQQSLPQNISNDLIAKQNLGLVKALGPIKKLKEAYQTFKITGAIGIGHTRWATHGSVTITNAHPIVIENLAIVHNGVVDNYLELHQYLVDHYSFVPQSETDTEIILALIYYYNLQEQNLMKAIELARKKILGKLAFVLMSPLENRLIAVSSGRPLIIGFGEKRDYITSDSIALPQDVKTFISLDQDDLALLSSDGLNIFNLEGEEVFRPKIEFYYQEYKSLYDNYSTFMEKEIYEQKTVLTGILNNLSLNISKPEKVHIIACGAAYYAGYVGKYLLERDSKILASLDIASEFALRKPFLDKKTLYIFISQSGETADTIAAMELVKAFGAPTLALVNREASPLAKSCDNFIPLKAGLEQSVAATKTFTAQVLVITLLAQSWSDESSYKKEEFLQLKKDIAQIEISEELNKSLEIAAESIIGSEKLLYLAKNHLYPIALEGALKIKEIGYIAAEALAAGEVKHGPIALVDEKTPVVILAPHSEGEIFHKLVTNIQEIKARRGRIILITNSKGAELLSHYTNRTILIPDSGILAEPILYALPMQLLAYHYAKKMGFNIDKPRNLAKSVTVE
jgi:glucosamine--fructose-6-phosphate aminotransferase (isomerizing)